MVGIKNQTISEYAKISGIRLKQVLDDLKNAGFSCKEYDFVSKEMRRELSACYKSRNKNGKSNRERAKEEKERELKEEKERELKEKKFQDTLLKRKAKSERKPVQLFIDHIKEHGLNSIKLDNAPFRLKRNESLYFISGSKKDLSFSISLALTNTRLFFSESTSFHKECRIDKIDHFTVIRGIKTVPLSSVIAIDEPLADSTHTKWKVCLHLSNGSCISISFLSCSASRIFYTNAIELIDRLNDPVDETAFSPTRERVPDEVKVVVWRRDNGICVKCGSRNNLEYDHIIPVSKGGSNTIRNIEFLCQSCNRSKSDKIS
ncbi:MAG: HNH endonuclease [Methylococcales symbiont of Hymedesmia sp. n. MRB-2018]|nr:MAG: HNH endonuclease [Methylococcales symbiont of Hymedesmia sp. n. MRB-2018]